MYTLALADKCLAAMSDCSVISFTYSFLSISTIVRINKKKIHYEPNERIQQKKTYKTFISTS